MQENYCQFQFSGWIYNCSGVFFPKKNVSHNCSDTFYFCKPKKSSITLKSSETFPGKLKSLLSHTVCNFTRCIVDPIIDATPLQSLFEELATVFFMLKSSKRSFVIIQTLRILTGQAKLTLAEYFLLKKSNLIHM